MRLLWIGWMFALLGVVMESIAGPGHRLGWWPFTTGFSMLSYGAIAALLSVPLLAWTAWRTSLRRVRVYAGVGLIMAFVATAVPLSWFYRANTLPVIHDISTDLEHPPEFVAVVPLRRDATNPITYGGPEVAEQQRRAYPDVMPLRLRIPPGEAYARVVVTARRMGWDLVAEDPQSGRFEATATTPLFGFKDDVVVRVTAEGSGSRIDVRSVSRVGRSDVGANARRIREFLQELREG